MRGRSFVKTVFCRKFKLVRIYVEDKTLEGLYAIK